MCPNPSLIHPSSAGSIQEQEITSENLPDFRNLGTKVALVTMPFSYSKFPSIQLGTLSALLKSQGIGVKTYHFNLQFAHKIGVPLYEILCEKRGLFGEWLFSALLFRDNPKHAEYPKVFKPVFESTAREAGCSMDFLQDIERSIAPQFLTWALTNVEWGQYDVVGFTSTFDQNVASLSLAKLLKDIYPDLRIVFGGANFDGEMGLEQFKAFPWIDYVVSGEGEQTFPSLVNKILTRKEENIPQGIVYRKNGDIHFIPNERLVRKFDQLPPPDYDDYFAELNELDPQGSTGLNRILLYEGSRGCWWGEKHHCTFCGLNAQAMDFRAKAPAQVAAELDYLSSRYDTGRFRLVDNIIDMKYVDSLFGQLAQQHVDLDVFMETKSNLNKRQIQTLAMGGVKCMQPGIESLSRAQLKEMDKGVTPLQNIQCLKWSRYYNIDLSWNILLGFPEETSADYQQQIDLIPSLLHLQPPEATSKLWLERFSPYFKWPERYGIRLTGPGLAYAYVYDERKVDLQKIAYDFEYDFDWKVDPALYEELIRLVQEWKRRYHSSNRPFLFFSKGLSYLTIYDGRGDTPTSERFDGQAGFILEFCHDQPKSFEQIRKGWGEATPSQFGGQSSDGIITPIADTLKTLQGKRLLYEEGGRYFTLALPVNPYR